MKELLGSDMAVDGLQVRLPREQVVAGGRQQFLFMGLAPSGGGEQIGRICVFPKVIFNILIFPIILIIILF
jgi:hypothetical protein